MSRIFKMISVLLLVFTASVLFAQNPEPAEWFAGDMHAHRSCGDAPVSVPSIYQKMRDQKLAAVSLLADMGNGQVQDATLDLPKVNGADEAGSIPGQILHWDAEWHWDATFTFYEHQALGGHIVALGLKDSQKIWEESTFPILTWAHKQNGIAGFAHLQYLPDGIPQTLNCCTPAEYPVEVGLGAADFISEDVTGGDVALDSYYRLLNSGLRPGFAAGSDYPCTGMLTVGSPMTYVHLANGDMTYRNWIEGISAGRTVVSRNGHNEFLNLLVNGNAGPGNEVIVSNGGSVTVSAEWTATGDYSGNLEIVSNGVVTKSQSASVTSGTSAIVSDTLTFTKSGWIAARRMGSNGHVLHTAAVFIKVDNAPVRASSDDALFFVDWIDNLLTKTSVGGIWNSYFPTTLTPVQARYQSAKALFQQIANEAQAPGTAPTLTSITLAPSSQDLIDGSTQQFTATGLYSDGSLLDLTGQVVWTSSDASVAKINTRGLTVAVQPGSALISARLGAVSGDATVNAQPAPLAITTDTLPAAWANSTYSTIVAATGGTTPYDWSITSGSLPSGLTLNATTGEISGTPSALGSFNLTLTVTDSANVTASKSLTLTVMNAGVCPCTIWPSTATPALVDSGYDQPLELGVKFKSDVSGYISAIRFYKSAANTGLHVGNLWTTSGIKLATVTFTGETASGWQQANLATPVAVTAGTVYVVSYHANNGHYSDDNPYFQQAYDNAPLHALADGDLGEANGVYAYGATSVFPDQTWKSSNYWVDAVLTSTAVPTYSITGVITGPAAVGTTVTLTGSASATETSDATGTFTFSGFAGGDFTITPSKAGYTFSPSSQSVTITGADVTLAAFTSVANVVSHSISGTVSGPAAIGTTLTLSGASTGSTTSDASGNYTFANLDDGSYTVTASKAGYTFTPANIPVALNGSDYTGANFGSSPITGGNTCPCSIWAATTIPGVPSSNDPSAAELGVRFRSDFDGVITGIRFYKGVDNTGTHIGNLWSNGGAILASAVFTNETASGWQEVSFETPVAIQANTTYVASYHTDAGHYAFDQQYFSSTYNNAPLHALANGLDGNNGVYRYGASGFPDATFGSSNYWVDVVLAGPTFGISGKVSGPGGNLATISVTGSATSSTITDALGNYAFLGLPNGTYTVTPSKPTFSFGPASQNITISGASVGNVNFSSGTQLYSISGTISGAGGNGATVTLSGDASGTVIADASGNYTFSVADGAYTVTPSNTGFTFTPTSQNKVVNGAPVTGVDFETVIPTYSITGTISGPGGDGATVMLSGASSATTTADASGNYTFPGLVDGLYTVTPSKTAYVFTPGSLDVTISGVAMVANFSSIFVPTEAVPFHDDFNRLVLGSNYDTMTGEYDSLPVLNGSTFAGTDPTTNSWALVSSSAASIGPDQFARTKIVNDGISSLLLRMTLLPDGSDVVSGYEVDFGPIRGGTGHWFAVYAIVATGYEVLDVSYPSAVDVPPGAVVDFRVKGTTLELRVDGTIVWTGTHTGVASGAPGLGVYDGAALDEFFTGNY